MKCVWVAQSRGAGVSPAFLRRIETNKPAGETTAPLNTGATYIGS